MELSKKHGSVNTELQELRHKWTAILSEGDVTKNSKDRAALDIIRLKKEIAICREQL